MARKPSFGQLIRNTRQQRELSVPELADRVGVSTAAIYMWETDRGRPRDANVSALCKVLKLPVRATKELAAAQFTYETGDAAGPRIFLLGMRAGCALSSFASMVLCCTAQMPETINIHSDGGIVGTMGVRYSHCPAYTWATKEERYGIASIVVSAYIVDER